MSEEAPIISDEESVRSQRMMSGIRSGVYPNYWSGSLDLAEVGKLA